ncbi:MAG: hypothetical protein EOO15_12565, partial [Chitinophagaceae bacterium]
MRTRILHAVFTSLFVSLGSLVSHAQTTYYSKAAATDFADVASWGTNTNGTGTSPALLGAPDIYVVANGASMTLNADAAVGKLTINNGTLAVASNTLTVSLAGVYNSTLLINGGTLNVSGGNVVVNGNFSLTTGGRFNQSGGTISVDGNNGGSTTGSVATSTPIVGLSPAANTDVTMSAGTFIIVDPHTSPSTSTFQATFPTAGSVGATGTHTFKTGNGVSTDAGGSLGFRLETWISNGLFVFRNLTLESTGGGTNRFTSHVTTFSPVVVSADLTIKSTAELRCNSTSTTTNALYLAGNLVNDGTL